MLKSSAEGENKVVMKNGEKWVYKILDKHVHKKGWTEHTQGHGTSRAVADQDFEGMGAMMKKCGWEHSLGGISKKEDKALEDKGEIPEKTIEKLKKATTVWVQILKCIMTWARATCCIINYSKTKKVYV